MFIQQTLKKLTSVCQAPYQALGTVVNTEDAVLVPVDIWGESGRHEAAYK